MQAFHRTRSGYVTRLDDDERRILARVVADVAEVLGVDVAQERPGKGEGPGRVALEEPVTPPAVASDPALARLLPPASEDGELAAQVHDLTAASIVGAKAERLRQVWWDLQASGARVVVPAERAMSWAGALTDVRLVLADRLGIADPAESEERLEGLAASRDDLARAMVSLYLALGWLQDSLVEAMLGDLPGA